ncbi:hypothetical protein HanXRQr2_Chr12g0532261 [Helianthus annuus]|uniref:Uncharacterized protein n=1 Tax=Helianthus annuus TaxID=4232 RepID=A0A9K3HF43_HELAN|nr:hypothetical protein HanXRQr2_Chr12g0532261 [Helianthus annuus]
MIRQSDSENFTSSKFISKSVIGWKLEVILGTTTLSQQTHLYKQVRYQNIHNIHSKKSKDNKMCIQIHPQKYQ